MACMSVRSTVGMIFLVAAVLGSSPAMAQKVDLSAFLGNVPTVGDTRFYSISNGDFLVQEVVEVQLTTKGWRTVVRTQQTDQSEVFAESIIVPGKQQLMGDIISVPLSIDLKQPKKIQKFAYTLGKRQRKWIKGLAFTDLSQPIGKALILAESEFLGFETIDTPLGSFPEAASLQASITMGITDSLTGDTVSAALWQTAWIDPFLGAVSILRSTTTYLNGVQQSDTGMQALTLESALIDGIAYP